MKKYFCSFTYKDKLLWFIPINMFGNSVISLESFEWFDIPRVQDFIQKTVGCRNPIVLSWKELEW